MPNGICAWRKEEEVGKLSREAFGVLRPSDRSPALPPAVKGASGRLNLATRRVAAGDVERLRKAFGTAADARLGFKLLASSPKWEVAAMSDQTASGAWGVLLARPAGRSDWTALYTLPAGTSYKVAVFTPKLVFVGEQQVRGSFCTDCTGWGQFADYVIDLSTMSMRAAADEAPKSPAVP